MKKVFVFLFIFVTFFTFSCNHSKITNDIQPSAKSNNIAKKGAKVGTQAQSFVSSFYKNVSYTIGKQAQTSDNGVNYLVSEIIINDEARARGYITTDLAGENPTYFVDVDRVNYTLTSVNTATNQTVVSNEINKNPKYIETSEYDIIIIISNPPTTYEDEINPFFGWGEWSYGKCNAFGYRVAKRRFYVTWIPVDKETKEVGCNEKLD